MLSVPDALGLEQLADRHFVRTLPFPGGRSRPLRVLGSPFQVDGAAVTDATPPPTLGEHTAQTLAELGYSAAEIATMKERGTV